MTYQVVADCAQVSVIGTLDGQECVNTYYYRHAAGWGLGELQALASAIDSVVASNQLLICSPNYSYLRTEARDLRSPVGFIATEDSGAGAGVKTGAAVPNNVAISVKRSSGLTGRSSRGRIYFPVTTDGNLSAPNVISDAFHDAVMGLLNSFDSIADSVDWTAVIVSRVGVGTSPVAAVVYTLAEWVIVNLVVDSMRRRLPGRGA